MYDRYMTNISVGDWSLKPAIDPENLPTVADVDVVVVGAGAAGVAAATVLAESGVSVAVVEKYGFAGGAAVAGLSGTVCGMYLASDHLTAPEQIVFGFTERFASELRRRGGLTTPQKYGKTWTSAHDPLMWRESADHLMSSAGARVFFHTSVVGVLTDDVAHTGVIVSSNAGLALIRAKRTIDASGDAAVIARAGYRYGFGDNGKIQNPTMFFRLGGVNVSEFLAAYGDDTICPSWVSDEILAARDRGADLPRQKIWIFTTSRPGELLVNATRLEGADGRMLNVIDPEDFTEAEIRGRAQVRQYAAFLRSHIPGCESSYVLDTGVEAGVRQTRSIVGAHTLTNADVVDAVKSDQSICRSPWPIELHSGDRPKLHWVLDDYYDVPYLTLVPEVGENIIVAGRCLSAEHEALASARVTAQCFEYGHAAAQATLESLKQDRPYRDLDVGAIQQRMRAAGSAL